MSSLLSEAAEGELVRRGGTHYASRLRQCCSAASSTRDGALMPGVYAITGGLGGLGLRAGALAQARHAFAAAERLDPGHSFGDALLMQARLGRNIRRATTVSELTASACDDATRLARLPARRARFQKRESVA